MTFDKQSNGRRAAESKLNHSCNRRLNLTRGNSLFRGYAVKCFKTQYPATWRQKLFLKWFITKFKELNHNLRIRRKPLKHNTEETGKHNGFTSYSDLIWSDSTDFPKDGVRNFCIQFLYQNWRRSRGTGGTGPQRFYLLRVYVCLWYCYGIAFSFEPGSADNIELMPMGDAR